MPLFTPEKKLEQCDIHFTELSEQFSKKIKELIDTWTYIYEVSRLIDAQRHVLDEFATCLNNRKDMTPTANELMEEINRIERLCDRNQETLTLLDEVVTKYHIREKAKKRKEKLNNIAMWVAGFVLMALFIGAYVTFRFMAG